MTQPQPQDKLIIYALNQELCEITPEEYDANPQEAVFVTNAVNAQLAIEKASIAYNGELNLQNIEFCKIESLQECIVGTLDIPKLPDVKGSRFKVIILINQKNIVIIDNEVFSSNIINRIKRNRNTQGQSREMFIYNFMTQLMSRDLGVLGQYEHTIMRMEEELEDGKSDNFQTKLSPIRKELLILRSYYDELVDMSKQLEENENNFFAEKKLKYFGIISDRADRLLGRTIHLLDYSSQVKDTYQSRVSEQQNKNMQFLTVISTIFYPLTLITGWYGMNFHNMPELANGYPAVILLSVVVVVACIIIFKIKKII